MELFFDTETSDKFNFKTQRYTDDNFPWMVQLGAILADENIVYAELNLIVLPKGRKISDGAAAVHNISNEIAEKVGVSEEIVMDNFIELYSRAKTLVAHNYEFDSQIVAALLYRNDEKQYANKVIHTPDHFCTMKETTEICKLPGPYGFKWPKLSELYEFLFNEGFVGAHDAMFDIRATMKCYYELKRRELI
uniref:Putative exonuclease n=2 Tax=viral metagenome TaxID=1070528 RepID=A0A6M3XU98_9ZZZZ